MKGNRLTLLRFYKACDWDEGNDKLYNLYDYIDNMLETRDIHALKNIMTLAFERSCLFDVAIDMEIRDYDTFCRELWDVENAAKVEKETGERPFWSLEDFELWLDKVEVFYEHEEGFKEVENE